jgi:phosphoglycolate phosphatase-like HAD superfamily hydrolase
MSKHIIIADLDGTLADLTHRLHHIKGGKKNWGAFHAECVNDKPITDVIEIVDTFRLGNCGCGYPRKELYVLSGRNAIVRKETTQWLEEHVSGVEDWDTRLLMRKGHDFRPDTEVKLEMVQDLGITPDDVLCIFDDRQSVVDMWRANGYRCLQVNAWKE